MVQETVLAAAAFARRSRQAALPIRCAALAILLCSLPSLASAASRSSASRATASASAAIIRPITVTALAELSFGKLQHTGRADGYVTLPAAAPSTRTAIRVTLLSGGGETALIRSLAGEPNRIYRVTLPASVLTTRGGLTVGSFSLWSATNSDITGTKLGAFNAQGTDTLRLGGTLTVSKGTKIGIYDAKVPLTISYE